MSDVVAIPAPSVIYREEQNFAWWVYFGLAVLVAISWLAPRALLSGRIPQPAEVGQIGRGFPSFAWILSMGLPVILLVGVLRMTAEVRPDVLRVWFGWIPTYRQEILLSAIRSVEPVRYQPIAEHGFWGVRRGKDGERVLSARGNQGVRLVLADGSRILIGSQRPEELAEILAKTILGPS